MIASRGFRVAVLLSCGLALSSCEKKSSKTPDGTGAAATEGELFAGCEGAAIEEGVVAYYCPAFVAIMSEDAQMAPNVALAETNAGLMREMEAEAKVESKAVTFAVAGQEMAGHHLSAVYTDPQQPDIDYDVVAYPHGSGMRALICMYSAGDEAGRGKCGEAFDFFVRHGQPVGVQLKSAPAPMIGDTRIAVPAGCEAETEAHGARILCPNAEVRWIRVDDISQSDALLDQAINAFHESVGTQAAVETVQCRVRGVEGNCRRMVVEADGRTARVLFAVAPHAAGPLFAACVHEGGEPLPPPCDAVLAVGDDWKTGIPECDELWERSMACYEKMGDVAVEAKRAFQKGAEAWNDLARTPETRAQAADACGQALEAAKPGWEAAGC